MPEFVHLHVHSEYSLLDGLSRTKGLAARAKEYGMPAVAITDHGTMFAAIEFHDACKANGVKPIIGVESYLAPRRMSDRDGKLDRSPYHLLLLAENETGYKNLLKVASLSQLEGFYQKPRVDKEALERLAEGVIATTGCMGAEIPQMLLQGKVKQARDLADWYRQIFKDRFYVELQEHGIPELTAINPELVKMARDFDLKLVATNDVHYIGKDDWFAQDVLLCVQTGATVNQTDRMRMDGHDYWFKTANEMAEVWRDYPEALSTTLEIAERCNVDLSFKEYHLPNFTVPEGYTPENYLRALCDQGFIQRYGEASPAHVERLNYELGVIHKMGFDTYFLIVWDLTRHARERGIWANARGSAAGSMVAYCLGITHLDPLEHNLIFERFLNPERISMPDIDLDFPDDARQEMINYTVQKYGKDNVAQIITFGKMLAKAALRDVGRALDYPLSEVDRVAKLIPVGPGKTIDGTLEEVREFRELYETSDYLRTLIDNAKLLEGVARNASTHAAGVVVTDKPVIEYTPLHRPTRGDESGTPVTQFPMSDIEHIGLLKIDFLGLAHLTIVREACALIKERHDIEFTLSNIPVEDPKAFELLSRGDVIGVFQVEGCLSGDTQIGHRTLQELYRDFSSRTEHTQQWHSGFKTKSVYLDEGQLTWNKIENVVYSGVKPVYRLVNEHGYWIKATADHHFLTKRGWIRLGELDPATDVVLYKPTASRVGRSCARCRKPLKSVSKRVRYCNTCSSTVTANPSRPEVQARISQSKLDTVPWNRGLNAQNAAHTTWIQKLRAYGESQRGHSMEERLGAEKAAAVKAKMSERFSGKGNPMYGRPPKTTKTYTKDGFRADLGHYVRSSWEADLARVFRYLELEYQYEPRTFELVSSDGHTLTYTPDFYVPALKQWFEVKGWMDETSARKLDLFRQQYPECDLVVVDKTRFAEFELEYADLVQWECPEIPTETEWVKIAQVEYVGEENTYDIQMRAPGNNFVANGFVVHNSGMKRVLTQMRPSKFDHLVATIALYRPGPMDYIPDYIARLHGEQKIEYRHPALEPILSDTYGIMVYQEQIMRIARDCCSYTGGEADTLRKAVGKKNKEAILKQREKFIAGADKAGIIPKETAEKIFDDIEFFARYGFNKCLTADTRIVDAGTGRLTTIGALYQSRATFDTPSLEENGRVTARPISAVMSNGVKPVYRLRTRSGREIRATANHPFRTFDGWTKLEDLRTGELIAAPRFIPYTPSTSLCAHELVVLATALGEGNLCHPHSFYAYTTDEQQLADYVSHLECFENTRAVIDRSKSAVSVYARRNDVKQPCGAVEFIQRAGLHGKRAVEKFIPGIVFGLPPDQLALFLGRLWSADGCIHPKTLSLYYATSLHELAQQVQHLLLRFGIQATLHTKEFKYRGGIRIGYTINVLGGHAAVMRFAETMGAYLVGHTRENLEQLLARYTRLSESHAHGTVEIVPAAVHTILRAEMEQRGLGPKPFSRVTGIAERLMYYDERKRGFRRDTLADIARALDSETLRAHAGSDIFWDEIESIEPDGIEETFDLTVPETHNFVANDLIVHNSHAAVYAVLTGQTAFLKAHYAIEYMTALLCTDIGNTEKVAMFVADVRHQGIQILPPDVRYSNLKFTIDDSVRGIRFGLLGVKNVGEGPIEAILAGRGDKPFETLDDFCTRVDLKQVNRRVLESLIKAGAFDAFGTRGQLLEAIDRMLSVSSSHHNASAAGQMSLFGGAVAVDTFGDLPLADEVDHKTQLEWEKELMGVYFSPHPLLKLAEAGKKHVGAYTGEITHESDGQQVTIGGIIKSMRQITTKKGDAMAFLQVEDPQGSIEVVTFPRTFNDCRDVIHEDALVLVRGKVQVRDDKIAILADLIWNYPIETPKPEAVHKADRPIPGIFSNTPVIVPTPAPTVNDFVEHAADDNWMPPPGDWEEEPADHSAPAADTGPQITERSNAADETQSVVVAEGKNIAPAAAEHVPDWATPDTQTPAPGTGAASSAAAAEPVATVIAPFVPPLVLESQVIQEKKPEPAPVSPPPAPKAALPEIKLGGGVAIPSKNGSPARPQHGAPAPRGNNTSNNSARESAPPYTARGNSTLKVRVRILERTNDQALDTKRMRDVVKLLRSAEGRDRFALIVPHQKSWVELDFPNFYTNFQTVQNALLEMVGEWGEIEIG